MTEGLQERLEQALASVVDEDRGSVSLAGSTFVLVQRETLANMQKGLEEILGRGAEGVLMRAGYTRGRELLDTLSGVAGAEPTGLIEGLRVFGRRTGQFGLEEWQVKDGELTLCLANSAIGCGYGRSDRPVCHYLRGTLLVMGERILGRTGLECRETRCVATGASECAFTIRPALVLANPETLAGRRG